MAISPPIDSPARDLPEPRREPGPDTVAVEQRAVIPRHIASLDGLRALAILAVIFHHCGEYFLVRTPSAYFLFEIVEGSGLGVDLFFALSGFLITAILLDTSERQDYFRRFYWRRALRIWPLYYAFLLAALFVHSSTFKGLGFTPFALYYRNFLGPDPISDITLGHFWSLCVEEQFYLVWPVVIYFCARRFGIVLIPTLMLVAFLLRFYLLHQGMDPYIVQRLPFCRMDSLLSGAAVAVLVKHWTPGSVRRVAGVATGAGIVGAVLCQPIGVPETLHRFLLIGLTSWALLFGGVVALCVTGLSERPSRILGSPALKAISMRSYAMYVFHLIPLYALYTLLSRSHRLPHRRVPEYGLIVAVALVTYGLAWLSWRFFEEPILRFKNTRFA